MSLKRIWNRAIKSSKVVFVALNDYENLEIGMKIILKMAFSSTDLSFRK